MASASCDDPELVQTAYDVLAPAYDLLTADYAYEPWLWRGGADQAFAPAGRARAVIDVFERADGAWTRVTSQHQQRHWPVADLLDAARRARLTVLAVHGQHRGARLEASLDEDAHPKALFVACRDDRPPEGRCAMRIGSP